MLTPDQLKERIGYIGASDAAAVIGMSRWKTPLQVWAEKTGLIEPDDLSENLAVELGNELEPFVATKFSKITGKKVEVCPETIYHPEHRFIAANIDRRVAGENAVLECKTASAWKAKEWEGEEFPPEYVIQVWHQLAVTGAEVGYLAVLIGNADFKIKEVRRDEKVIKDLIAREVKFWTEFVVPKVPPSVKAKDSNTLLALFPNADTEEPISLSDEANATAELLEGMERDHRALGAQIEEQKNRIKIMLGKAKCGTTGLWEFKWSNVPETPIAAFTKKAYRKFSYRKKEDQDNGENG